MLTRIATGKCPKQDLPDFMIWQDWEFPVNEQFQS